MSKSSVISTVYVGLHRLKLKQIGLTGWTKSQELLHPSWILTCIRCTLYFSSPWTGYLLSYDESISNGKSFIFFFGSWIREKMIMIKFMIPLVHLLVDLLITVEVLQITWDSTGWILFPRFWGKYLAMINVLNVVLLTLIGHLWILAS